ncbi:uncharacterized protein G2W53_022626 [Senna tora]|uniref:Uncharacterized protein n=1 Tax=Senna tora TaxID=362788 RepID=A0A834WIX2_9FABA|nr:uncharacterized protein G2W53_022626 [Senna tora]
MATMQCQRSCYEKCETKCHSTTGQTHQAHHSTTQAQCYGQTNHNNNGHGHGQCQYQCQCKSQSQGQGHSHHNRYAIARQAQGQCFGQANHHNNNGHGHGQGHVAQGQCFGGQTHQSQSKTNSSSCHGQVGVAHNKKKPCGGSSHENKTKRSEGDVEHASPKQVVLEHERLATDLGHEQVIVLSVTFFCTIDGIVPYGAPSRRGVKLLPSPDVSLCDNRILNSFMIVDLSKGQEG